MLRPGRGGGAAAAAALPSYGGSGGYGDMPAHVQYDADQKYGRRRRSGGTGAAGAAKSGPLVCVGIACVVLFAATAYYSHTENRLAKRLGVESIEQAVERMTAVQREDELGNHKKPNALQERHYKLEEHNRVLEQQAAELRKKVQSSSTNTNDNNEGYKRTIEHYTKREQAWKHQMEKLQNATARESRRTVLERFGPGPHRVKFFLRQWDDDDDDGGDPAKFFVAELAPLDWMPHAVHLFLEQVAHKLWDETWFYLNSPHVLQAGPQTYEEDEPDEIEEAKLKEFERLQLKTLAFPEYSPKFPHVPWSMGFTGRPGGPDWYINKSDNSKVHGPGGQRQHALVEQADPCFARVVEGKEMLERLFKEEVYQDAEFASFFVDPISIVKARIVSPSGTFGEQTEQEEKSEQRKTAEEKKEKHKEEKKEHVHKKPLVSHRVENDDDDILTEEDWHYEDEHYEDEHEEHHVE